MILVQLKPDTLLIMPVLAPVLKVQTLLIMSVQLLCDFEY